MTFRGWDKEKISLQDGTEVNAICPVIISSSRATDIPAYFSKWFLNRLNAGYMSWKNPFNAKQIQYISFSRTRVFVFWTKNPKPFLKHLPKIDATGVSYYFQFTLNDYEIEGLEPNVPKLEDRIDTFINLSKKIGSKRVIWRFDPLILSDTLSIDELLNRIRGIGSKIHTYTNKLVFSFVDICNYKKVKNNLTHLPHGFKEFTKAQMLDFAEKLSVLNEGWELEIATCAEGVDLESFGIRHNRCIDDKLMVNQFSNDSDLMSFLGYEPNLFNNDSEPNLKDKGQRKECGCIVSKDIGAYNTCNHLCTYCYANVSYKTVKNNLKKHNSEADTIL